MAVNGRKKTVSFYEIVKAKDAVNKKIGDFDWQEVLKRISDLPYRQRICTDSRENYYGTCVLLDKVRHLAVARVRDGDIQQVDWDANGRISNLHLGEKRSVVDTTIISFLPFGSVIGVLQGGTSAPRTGAVQRWLNSLDTGLGEDIAISPLLSSSAQEKLNRAEALDFFEMRMRPGPVNMFDSHSHGLADAGRILHRHNPDIMITLSMKVAKRGFFGRGTPRARGEKKLREDVQLLIHQYAELIGPDAAVDRAIANVILTGSDGELAEEKINFISDHITAQKPIVLRRSRSGAPWYEAAVRAIADVVREHEQEIRDAVSVLP